MNIDKINELNMDIDKAKEALEALYSNRAAGIRCYVDKGFSVGDIAKAFNISRVMVHKVLKRPA